VAYRVRRDCGHARGACDGHLEELEETGDEPIANVQAIHVGVSGENHFVVAQVISRLRSQMLSGLPLSVTMMNFALAKDSFASKFLP
jgi:hypothetical protein